MKKVILPFLYCSDLDSELSWERSAGQAAELERDADEDVKDLKGNRMLSTEAKNILSDLDLDTDDESGESVLPGSHKNNLIS